MTNEHPNNRFAWLFGIVLIPLSIPFFVVVRFHQKMKNNLIRIRLEMNVSRDNVVNEKCIKFTAQCERDSVKWTKKKTRDDTHKMR